MQDPATFPAPARFPEEQGHVAAAVKCPRCDSPDTKFCYYNNYNLSQPRHFCKSCRRYWTKGGALRNVPVGGGTRKGGKRPRKPDSTRTRRALQLSSTSSTVQDSGLGSDPERVYGFFGGQDRKMPDIAGSFSSLLTPSGQFGSLLEGLNSNGSGPETVKLGEFGEELNGDGSGMESDPGRCSGLDEQSNDGSESFVLQSGESSYWPDLGIYTPGSCFQ